LKYNNSYGNISWNNETAGGFLSNLTINPGSNLTFPGNIIIGNNSAYFNSSAFSGQRINSSANISLNLAGWTLADPQILKDGLVCTDCYNFTPLNSDLVIFNVSSWSNYTIGTESIYPNVAFVNQTPATGTSQKQNSVLINVSSSDDNGQHYSFVNWNRELDLWYTYDNISGNQVIDLSGYGRDGLISSANPSDGKFGQAMSLEDGTILSPIEEELANFSTNITMSIWVNDVVISDGYNPVIFGSTSYIARMILVDDSLDDDYGKICNLLYNSSLNLVYVCEQDAHTKGTWYNYIFRREENNLTLWKNGVLQNSVDIPSFWDILPTDGFYAPAWSFNGSVDEAMLFSRALSEAEIKSLYDSSVNQYYKNFTGLSDGIYNYTAYAVDLAGNINFTETRTLTVDNIAPFVQFVNQTPATGTLQSDNSVLINLSSNDTSGEHFTLLDFNRSLVAWYTMDDINICIMDFL